SACMASPPTSGTCTGSVVPSRLSVSTSNDPATMAVAPSFICIKNSPSFRQPSQPQSSRLAVIVPHRRMRGRELLGNANPLALRKLIAELVREHRPPDTARCPLSENLLRLLRQHRVDEDLENERLELAIHVARG